MSFRDQLRAFSRKIEIRNRDVFVGTVSAAHESIVNGSVVTGAPGQPVDTGRLRASWTIGFDSPTTATIGTNVEYAAANEYGVNQGRPYNQRSQVGGRHSVELTIGGIQKLIDIETRKVVSRG